MISPGPPPSGGGIGAYTEKTARALAARGHEVHVIVRGTSRLATETVDGVEMHRVPTPNFRPAALARSWAVSRALSRIGPLDIVQACEWEGEAWWYTLHGRSRVVTRLATPHFVIDQHERSAGHHPTAGLVRRFLERSQTRRSARVISPSRVLADEVARHWRLPAGAVTIVPTGIQPPRPEAGHLPESLRGHPYLLYFGRLERRKGVDTWIEALPRILEAQPELHAVFVGEDMGMDGRPFADLARERCHNCWDRLHFLPAATQSQLFPIVAGTRMVAMPSRFESLANACLEAMALGRPVVATTGTGLAEMITDMVDGFLITPGDASGLAEKVTSALADPALLKRVSQAAVRRAEDFDLGRMVDRLVTVYEEIAGRRTLAASSLSA